MSHVGGIFKNSGPDPQRDLQRDDCSYNVCREQRPSHNLACHLAVMQERHCDTLRCSGNLPRLMCEIALDCVDALALFPPKWSKIRHQPSALEKARRNLSFPTVTLMLSRVFFRKNLSFITR